MNRYLPVVGMEVHAELLTKSKMFCRCSTRFGAPPNSQTCPVCLGFPGVLPVTNKRAVEFTIMTALALDCEIARYAHFARKNYFYPDLPKNYQISQYELPLGKNGRLEIEIGGKKKAIRIRRVHLEEDTGRLIHMGDKSYIDFNRSGVPLMEIVTEPDINSPEEAKEFLERLRLLLQYLGVCDGKMEEGSLRCEPNISLYDLETDSWGTKVEIKNLGSIRAVGEALEYEINRQLKILQSGGTIVQETRGWSEERKETFSMRSKEEAHDYRYFPEPDIPPIIVDDEWLREIRERIPELPAEKEERFVKEMGLSKEEAHILVVSLPLARLFEEAISLYPEPKKVANWLISDFQGILNTEKKSIEEVPFRAEFLVEMLKLLDDGTISIRIAKEIFPQVVLEGKAPKKIVEEKGLLQIADEEVIRRIVMEVISEEKEAVEQYLKGKEKAMGFLMGQIMKKTKGKANPSIASQILKEKLEELKR
ncbi:Asp-tRNA(Asn)/Glu-tRNA(Gln) amidotransferase subunit GatB [bacterium]|nr:Asp-tRNA(Asn)/Glu-tRNA(Gln) amidotransferase subunit GatB [bacterium]